MATSRPLPPPRPAQLDALVAFLEHESEPMIVLDPHYTILAANAAYQRQFGGDGAANVGHKCYRVSHHYDVPCDQAGEHCPMKRVQESRGPDRVLHIHHTPRGPEHVEVELRPILDGHGAISAYVERLVVVRHASARPSGHGLVGRSAVFNRALAELRRVAPAMLPVLLLGASGTGKELFARAVHEASARAAGPFVVVDCSGLTETLFESELFGHEKGAFTGATARKQGLVETAQGGTLFLDEIGDVPLAMQVKLLRLIESGSYRRVGATDTLRADFRLVAATHKPLDAMMQAGQFRQDLYYRISAFPIHLPTLRERAGDIALLVQSFLGHRAAGGRALAIDAAALAQLERQPWPGNIRQLRNVLERACLFADDGVIRVEHLPPPDAPAAPAAAASISTAAAAAPAGRAADAAQLAALAAGFPGTRSALAAHLGVSERTLYRRLKARGPA